MEHLFIAVVHRLRKWCSMCGPNEREISLCIWKQIGTFCCSNWSRHCINMPQPRYLFSARSQIEPSIIIAYPGVRISPKRRFLCSGWTCDCSFHYPLKVLIQRRVLDSSLFDAVKQHCFWGPLCVPFLYICTMWKPEGLDVNTLFSPTSFSPSTPNCSLLCSGNRLPVISLPLKSPALVKMREICLCRAQSSTLQPSAAVWVSPQRQRRMDVRYTDEHLSNMSES